MAKIITVINQKGGVGKTTTSINLAAGLGYANKKTLLLDFDPQGNASNGLGCYLEKNMKSAIHALMGEDIKNCIYKTDVKNLDILPSDISLSEIELKKNELSENLFALKNTLKRIENEYDFIIIDCPPALGVLSQSVLIASNSLIIPIQCEYFALEGATQLLESIKQTKQMYNPDLTIEGVLITMVDARTKIATGIQEEVRRHFKDTVYKTVIPRNIKLSEAPAMGQTIYKYEPNSIGAKAYANLVYEFLERNKEKSK